MRYLENKYCCGVAKYGVAPVLLLWAELLKISQDDVANFNFMILPEIVNY